MNLRFLWIHVFALLLGVLSVPSAASPLTARMSSQFLVQGEQATLEYAVKDGINPRAQLKLDRVDGLEIRPIGLGAEPRIMFGRRREYVFRFMVTSYTPGNYTIPAARLVDEAGELEGPSVKLRIFKDTDLDWTTATAGGRTIQYAAAFHTIDDSPFVNEVLPTELKVYIPTDQRVEDWGIPEFQRDGVAAWRFEPRPTLGRANLRGRSYYSVSYPSTLSPTRAGAVTLGPAKLRLITIQTSLQNFNSAFYEPLNLSIPELTLDARALPPGAPEGFEDAVGQFEMSVNTTETEVREGDPVNVNITVSGAGNLDTLNAPKPIDSEGWKLYPPSSAQRDERREIEGFASFKQFMRPLIPQSQIPPFRLVYFDPQAEEYRTLLSAAIPLEVLPSTGVSMTSPTVPMALPMPIEEMTDILGVAKAGTRLLPEKSALKALSYWQFIPAAIALCLLLRIAQLHLFPRMKPDPERVARRRAIKELERAPQELSGFYRTAGHFAEEWLGSSRDEIVQEVLERRDATCFTGDAPDAKVSRAERQRVLRGLKRLALPLVTVMAFLSSMAHGDSGAMGETADSPPDSAQAAYEAKRWQDAARLWLESGPYERLPADTLYNIGNSAYRLGAPGEAALYWRRALTRDATHAEARQNLRFFERKFGSITIKRPDYQYTLTKISRGTWKQGIWFGVWMIGLAILIFPATRAGSRLRVPAITALVLAPLLIVTAMVGYRYYPDDAQFAPLEEQAVIISDRASIRTDAARLAPLVLDAPAGSLCRMIQETGDWIYVAFTNDTRGWVSKSEIEPLIPRETPEPPSPSTGPEDPTKST